MPRRGSLRLAIVVLLSAALALSATASAAADTVSFSFTGGEQTFVVPAGVTGLHVVAVGARGGGASGLASGAEGGFGAVVSGDVAVSPGETLYVEVGGAGGKGTGTGTGTGGFNGGGAGAGGESGEGAGGGGGGASDLRTLPRSNPASLGSRLIVAAGGGGAGGTGGSPGEMGGTGGGAGAAGSAGGGLSHGAGGGAASTTGPGTAGAGSPEGSPGQIGSGGSGGVTSADGGGGGGGGLYGGGGGGAANGGGGGGGGGGSSAGGAVAADSSGLASVTISYTANPVSAPSPSPGGGPTAQAPASPVRPPRTTITSHPPKLLTTKARKVTVKFGFTSSAGARFLCSIDGGRFSACRSPTTYLLAPGKHLFAVKAVKEGVADPTPDRFGFVVRRIGRPR